MNTIVMSALPNRHPVDQLALVRETIKELQAREAELKDEIGKLMGKADSLGGSEYIARQSITTRAGSVDYKAMERDGINVAKYRKDDTTVFSIRIERRAEELV